MCCHIGRLAALRTQFKAERSIPGLTNSAYSRAEPCRAPRVVGNKNITRSRAAIDWLTHAAAWPRPLPVIDSRAGQSQLRAPAARAWSPTAAVFPQLLGSRHYFSQLRLSDKTCCSLKILSCWVCTSFRKNCYILAQVLLYGIVVYQPRQNNGTALAYI